MIKAKNVIIALNTFKNKIWLKYVLHICGSAYLLDSQVGMLFSCIWLLKNHFLSLKIIIFPRVFVLRRGQFFLCIRFFCCRQSF